MNYSQLSTKHFSNMKVVVPILFACFVSLALADHLPEDKLAKGKSDSILCGVDVYKTPISQAIKKLGRPSDVSFTTEDGGGGDYIWVKGSIKIEMWTFNEKGTASIAYGVDVLGNRPEGEIGRTGRGLKLGDTIDEVRRIYGKRFMYHQNNDGTSQITLQWEDGTELILFFNINGHLCHMRLFAEVE